MQRPPFSPFFPRTLQLTETFLTLRFYATAVSNILLRDSKDRAVRTFLLAWVAAVRVAWPS